MRVLYIYVTKMNIYRCKILNSLPNNILFNFKNLERKNLPQEKWEDDKIKFI